MVRFILLDTGVLGLLYASPALLEARAFHEWLERMLARRSIVVIPEIVDYEARRELVGIGASEKLRRLDALRDELVVADVTAAAWRKATEFWAIVRQAGQPTADKHALDGDAILAGVAATIALPGHPVTIATTNVGHLTRFPGITAEWWAQVV